MGRVRLNPGGVNALASHPAIQARMKELGGDIEADAQSNVTAMGAVRTGHLRDSSFVDQENETTRIGFTVGYATYVHEGLGGDRNAGPRPFLAKAAVRDRGRLT